MPQVNGRDITIKRKIPSVLLASAASGGTLAAVRQLAAVGGDISVVSSQRLSAAAWSQCVSRSYSAPPEGDSARFLERLLAIGAADPGRLLLPTSDETAWLYSENLGLLEKHFLMYQPPLSTIRRILDKRLLVEAATAVGLPALPNWDPRSIEELESLAPSLPYPILIKPRTHVHRFRNDKGSVAYSKGELISQYQSFVNRESARNIDNPLLPDASLPVLQPFVIAATESVHSLTGFIDRGGELFVTRRSTKVFQRSPPVGVGVCFESLPAAPALSTAVRQLCLELGYFGIFEVEFIWFDGHWCIIDFNPRLFNQLGMDIRRKMPLPLLACLDATGQTEELRREVLAAQSAEEDLRTVFCDRFTLRAILLAQALLLRTSFKQRKRWYQWIENNASHTVDVRIDPTDRAPGIVHALSELCLGVKALPRFLRATPRAAADVSVTSVKAPS